MKNLHILPTSQPSIIFKSFLTNRLGFEPLRNLYRTGRLQNQNIYITSDEVIEDGDWYLSKGKTYVTKDNIELCHKWKYKKIILTTDLDLQKDDVQKIDDDFLEWFVKNPSCEEVETQLKLPWESSKDEYEIIIPREEPKRKIDTCYNFDMEIGCVQDICRCEQEEPKQDSLVEKMKPIQEQWQKDMEKSLNSKQEIIKESHKWLNDKFNGKGIEVRIIDWSKNEVNNYSPAKLIEEYAKWMQERSYSEEEVLDLLQKRTDYVLNPNTFLSDVKKWFEQFKKK